jgi:hypothetical protein
MFISQKVLSGPLGRAAPYRRDQHSLSPNGPPTIELSVTRFEHLPVKHSPDLKLLINVRKAVGTELLFRCTDGPLRGQRCKFERRKDSVTFTRDCGQHDSFLSTMVYLYMECCWNHIGASLTSLEACGVGSPIRENCSQVLNNMKSQLLGYLMSRLSRKMLPFRVQ